MLAVSELTYRRHLWLSNQPAKNKKHSVLGNLDLELILNAEPGAVATGCETQPGNCPNRLLVKEAENQLSGRA